MNQPIQPAASLCETQLRIRMSARRTTRGGAMLSQRDISSWMFDIGLRMTA